MNGYNVSLEIKHIFLNLLQGYYSNHRSLTWDYDVRNTNIIIADIHATDIGVAARRPSIFIKKGSFSWMYYNRGQDGYSPVNHRKKGIQGIATNPPFSSNITENKTYTDLAQASISLRVISKAGLQAEQIADEIFTLITAMKAELRKEGIFKITHMSVSDEQLLDAGAEIRLTGVTINVGFIMQHTVYEANKLYNVYLYEGEEEYFETLDFSVEENGTIIRFKEEIEDDTKVFTVNYTDAITLESKEDIELIRINNTDYSLSNNGSILGYYSISDSLEIES